MKIKKFFLYICTLFTLVVTGCGVTNPTNALQIYKEPDKLNYHVGDAFTLDGISVIDMYGLPVSDYTSSIKEGYVFKKEQEDLKVVLSKKNYESASFNIIVFANHMLEIATLPVKTTYYAGETFESEGLVVVDENGDLVTDYEVSLEDGFKFTTPGTVTVEVTKAEYRSATFNLTIENSKELVIKHMPNKVVFNAGDNFTSEGLVVGDNKGKDNLEFTTSIENGSILKYPGEIPVKISVDGYEDISYNIQVNKSESGSFEKEKNVNIYYINDTHGSFTRESSDNYAGMAYISSFMKEKKANKDENAIVLSGGDMFQGGYESNSTRGKIMVEAMNIASFDAMALGNHEFDWGEDVLKEALELAEFPVISANTFRKDRLSRPEWVSPYTIVERGDLKIGLVGFGRENMGSSILGSIAKEFYFPKPNEYIKKYAAELRLSYNCDLVLAVGHDEGYESGEATSPTKFKDLTEINKECGKKYVDGLFFAHDHNRKSGSYNGVPFIETGCNGKYMGTMSFVMDYNGAAYDIKSYDTKVNSAYSMCQNEDVLVTALLTKYSDLIQDPDRVVATLKNYYSKAEFAKLACEAMIWFVNNNKTEFDDTTVYVGTHNIEGIRVSTVSRGPLTYKQLLQACPFDNPITIQKLSKTHVERLSNSSGNACVVKSDIRYYSNVTFGVTISYVAEASDYNQLSYKEYPKYYCREAIIAYLNSSEGSAC